MIAGPFGELAEDRNRGVLLETPAAGDLGNPAGALNSSATLRPHEFGK